MNDEQSPTASSVTQEYSYQQILLTTHITTYNVENEVGIATGQKQNRMLTPQLCVVVYNGMFSSLSLGLSPFEMFACK